MADGNTPTTPGGTPPSPTNSGPGRPGWLPTQVSGKEVTSPPPPYAKLKARSPEV